MGKGWGQTEVKKRSQQLQGQSMCLWFYPLDNNIYYRDIRSTIKREVFVGQKAARGKCSKHSAGLASLLFGSCSWLNNGPSLKVMFECPPGPSEHGLIGSGSQDERILYLVWSLNPMTDILKKRWKDTEMWDRGLWEDRSGEWNHTALATATATAVATAKAKAFQKQEGERKGWHLILECSVFQNGKRYPIILTHPASGFLLL